MKTLRSFLSNHMQPSFRGGLVIPDENSDSILKPFVMAGVLLAIGYAAIMVLGRELALFTTDAL